jgi:hypothetical protein
MLHLLLILGGAFLASGVMVTALEEWAEHHHRTQEPIVDYYLPQLSTAAPQPLLSIRPSSMT